MIQLYLPTASKIIESLTVAALKSVSKAQEYCIKNNNVFNYCKATQMTLERHKNAVRGPHNLTKVKSTKSLGMTIDPLPFMACPSCIS